MIRDFRRTSIPTLLLFLCLLCACSPSFIKVGPDFERPDSPEVPPEYMNAQAYVDTSVVTPAAWWKVFGDGRIDSLVAEAIGNNLDIRAARASVRELSSLAWQSRAARLPSFNLSGNYRRQYSPEGQVSPAQPSPDRESESYSASVAAAFEIDLWGRLSRADEAARADLLAGTENMRTVMQSIVSETVSLCLQIDALEKRTVLTERNIDSARKSRDIVKARYDRGIVSMLDLTQAERGLAQAEAALPQIEQDLSTARHDLSVMLGRYPGVLSGGSIEIDHVLRLSPVPAGLPSDLLENRPDIRAAEARLHAAAARVGVAKSALFPRISLTGSYGYTSDELEGLFKPGNLLWNLVAGITQPLFNSGSLVAGKNAAWARYERSAADYAKTVLRAFAEVESALVAGEKQLRRREKNFELLEKAIAVERLASDRYRRGLTGYMTVLDAMQARYQAEQGLVLSDLSLLLSRVNLHRALGGEWFEDHESEKDEN